MLLQKYISLINWRQIIIHFLASCFFMYAFKTFAYLNYTIFIDDIRSSKQGLRGIDIRNYSPGVVSYFLIIPLYSAIIGLIIAFLISLSLSIKKRWFWLNSLIMFLLTFFLYRFDLLGWKYFSIVFLSFGQLFDNTFLEFLINGSIMLTIGILFFFLKISIDFIDKKN